MYGISQSWSYVPHVVPPLSAGLLLLVGSVVVLRHLWATIQFIVFHAWKPKETLNSYRGKDRSYALITGSGEGLGLGFAHELVSRGFGVIIHSNSKEELEAAETELQREHPEASILTLPFNAVDVSDEELEATIETISELPITILINNVGAVPTVPMLRELATYTSSEVDNVIMVNARFMAQVTRLMVPVLSRNKRSLILNLSSLTHFGLPWMAMYSATEGFITSFSHALNREAEELGLPVDCINVVPGELDNHSDKSASIWDSPSPRQFAEATLDKVDFAVWARMLDISPWFVHDIQHIAIARIPEVVRRNLWREYIQTKIKGLTNRKSQT